MKRFFTACIAAVPASVLWAAPAAAQGVVIIQGEITSNTTLTANNEYLLRGAVFVREGAKLTIKAGTHVFGEQASLGTLIIDRGAEINVQGTRAKPVVLTSDQPVGQRARGDWGGLILNGRAPLNVPGGEAEGEGDTGTYGGTQPNDSSGSIKYLRVEFAGIEFSPDNELNCMALQGVGRGTLLQYIQCHMNKDDGFEFFGGTAQLKYAISTGIGDDSFDATDGWTGAGQFWVAWQVGDDADQGFEIDNNAENNNLTPVTSPTVSHFTLIGDSTATYGSESDLGMLIREGAAGTWQNGIVAFFKEQGLMFEQKATYNNAVDGSLIVRSMIFQGNGSGAARLDDQGICDKDIDNPGGNKKQDTCEVVLASNFSGANTDIWISSALTEDLVNAEDTESGSCCPDNRGSAPNTPSFVWARDSIAYDGTVPVAPVPTSVKDGRGRNFFKKVKFIGALGPRGAHAKRFDGWTTYELS